MTPKPGSISTNHAGAVASGDSKSAEEITGKPGRKLIGIDGNWYDVTDFISRHPGGPVIESFIGHDASAAFHSAGHHNVLKYRRPVGTYTLPQRHPADKDFRELIECFRANGFYDTNWTWVFKKVLVCIFLLSLVITLLSVFEGPYSHYVAAIMLGLFWQQCGFFMHDFMHNHVFQDASKDRVCGLIFGNICFGVSAHWWKDEHIMHHALTCVVDPEKGFYDPQMREQVWAQHENLFPFFRGLLSYCLIKIQHITFIPVTTLCGRVAIIIDSFHAERRWYEWLGFVAHWAWISCLLSIIPTWRERIIFYCVAGVFQGVLHFQLVFSHYSKPFPLRDDYLSRSWHVQQVVTNLNIENPPYMDWFYGGLNFHIEHHLFQTMPRNNMRRASRHVRALCQKHDIPYDSVTFLGAFARTLSSLKRVSVHYSLDPR